MHPIQSHDLARQLLAARRADARPAPRLPRVRAAIGYRLVVIGWRLIDDARPRPA